MAEWQNGRMAGAQPSSLPTFQHLNLQTLLWLALLLVAAVSRLWDVGARTMSHDEALHAFYSWRLYDGQGYLHTPVTHGPFLFHLTALVYALFGASDATARLAPALFGVALVGLPYLLRQWIGQWGAWLSGLVLLVSPTALFYARYIRHDTPMAVWSLLMVAALFQFMATRHPAWLWVGGLSTALALCTKEIALIFGFVGLTFLGLAWLRDRVRPAVGRRWGLLGWGAVLLLAGFCATTRMTSLAAGGAFKALLPFACLALGLLLAVLLTIPRLPAADGRWGSLLAASERRVWRDVFLVGVLLFVLLHTTFLTNPAGLATGTVGALSYWLAQHRVQRGGQPWYYYGFVLALYEFLPLLFGSLGLGRFWLARTAWRAESRQTRDLVTFLAYWFLASLVIYSWAGEKMPWLTLHLVLPLALLSGWFLDRTLRSMDGAAPGQKGALGLLLALLVYLLLMLLDVRPFQGWSVWDLAETGRWLLAVAVGLVLLWAAWRLLRSLGGRSARQVAVVTLLVICGLLTVRFAWLASFIHADTPLEYLVYAHSSADVKRTMGQIEAISLAQTGERELRLLYDDDVRWILQWYLRDYPHAEMFGNELTAEDLIDAPLVILGDQNWQKNLPLLSDDYSRRDGRLLWWPLEAIYRDLTPGKVLSALRDSESRRSVWRLIWFRRYEYALSDWPLRHDYALFVRRDLIPWP
ncbi:MAG: flippase activity-associated protein Agl23 [Chloroflexota bacterium]